MRKKQFTERNRMSLCFPALSVNEGVARSAVAAFCAQQNPSATELADIKCAVSEAVTNCIVHAYRGTAGMIYITVVLGQDGNIRVVIKDKGCGIVDIRQAREPLFTTDAAGERSGMGFTVMENFMDRLRVRSRVGRGTVVMMTKRVGASLQKE